MTSSNVLRVDKATDVGILTIVPTEVEALFAALAISPSGYESTASPLQYWCTAYQSRSSGRELSIVVSILGGEAGSTEAAVATANFLRDWYPRLMCLVGISSGIEGKTRIADVVIPNKIHDRTIKVYESGVYRVRGRTFGRHDSLDRMLKVAPVSSQRLVEALTTTAVADLSSARRTAELKGFNTEKFDGSPRIIDGSIASDNVLIRDPQYFEGILEATDEKCRGGEMEAAGFVLACVRERPDFPWLVVRGVSDFGDSTKDDAFQLLAAKSACVALKLLLETTLSLDALASNPRALENATTLEFNLVYQLREAFAARRWKQVCRIGAVLSRPLWLSGHARLRYELGSLVESAAAFAKDPHLRARTLIDDLGWTSVILGDTLRAEKYILDGLRLGVECGDNYVIAKANRHLASLRRRAGDHDEVRKFLEVAEKAAGTIVDEDERQEMLSALYSSKAKMEYEAGRYREAAALHQTALEGFLALGDVEREVKVYAQLGLCAEKLGDHHRALDYYTTGRAKSRDAGRFDEFAENTRGVIRLLGNDTTKVNALARDVYDFALANGLWQAARDWEHEFQRLGAIFSIKRVKMPSAVIDTLTLTSLAAVVEGEDQKAALELLQVFDSNGNSLGAVPRLLCHRLGLLHGAVFCLIGAPDRRLLVQTRGGGKLDAAVGGHLSASDLDAKTAITREIREEIGLSIALTRLLLVAQYERRSPVRLAKPRDVNRELRTLYFLELDDPELQTLNDRFAHRMEKESVIAVQWMTADEILRASDADLVADGLVASISHYLLWRNAQDELRPHRPSP